MSGPSNVGSSATPLVRASPATALPPAAKARIRAALAEAFWQGQTADQVQALRRQLKETHGCDSVEQVGAVGAHDIIRAKRAIGATGLTGLSAERLVGGLYALRAANAPKLRAEVGRALLASLGSLGRLTATERSVRAALEHLATHSPEGKVELWKDALTGKTSGAHVEYRNPAKDRCNALWEQFLAARVTPAMQARGLAVSLTGKDPSDAIARLERVGIRRANIHAVEGGDEEARATLSLNAASERINAHLGRLEDKVREEDFLRHAFSVVELDFLGPACRPYEEIVQRLPLADHALVLVNVAGKREQRTIQERLRLDRMVADAIVAGHSDSQRRGTSFSPTDPGTLRVFLETNQRATTLPDNRDAGVHEMFVQALQRMDVHDHSPYAPQLDALSARIPGGVGRDIALLFGMTDVGHKLGELGAMIGLGAVNGTWDNPRRVGNVVTGFGLASIYHHRDVVSMERAQYRSPIGGRNSPYHTLFIEVRYPRAEYARWARSSRFLLDAASASATSTPDKPFGLGLGDEYGRLLRSTAGRNPRDIALIAQRGDELIAQTPFLRFIQHVKEWSVHSSRLRLNGAHERVKVVPQRIT